MLARDLAVWIAVAISAAGLTIVFVRLVAVLAADHQRTLDRLDRIEDRGRLLLTRLTVLKLRIEDLERFVSLPGEEVAARHKHPRPFVPRLDYPEVLPPETETSSSES